MTRFDDHIPGHLPQNQMGYDRALNIPCLKLFDHLGATLPCKLLQDVEVNNNSEEMKEEAEGQESTRFSLIQ